MLFFIVLKRSTSMQLNLIFPGTPQPHAHLWEALDEETRRAVLERLAELMANATRAAPVTQDDDHE